MVATRLKRFAGLPPIKSYKDTKTLEVYRSLARTGKELAPVLLGVDASQDHFVIYKIMDTFPGRIVEATERDILYAAQNRKIIEDNKKNDALEMERLRFEEELKKLPGRMLEVEKDVNARIDALVDTLSRLEKEIDEVKARNAKLTKALRSV